MGFGVRSSVSRDARSGVARGRENERRVLLPCCPAKHHRHEPRLARAVGVIGNNPINGRHHVGRSALSQRQSQAESRPRQDRRAGQWPGGEYENTRLNLHRNVPAQVLQHQASRLAVLKFKTFGAQLGADHCAAGARALEVTAGVSEAANFSAITAAVVTSPAAEAITYGHSKPLPGIAIGRKNMAAPPGCGIHVRAWQVKLIPDNLVNRVQARIIKGDFRRLPLVPFAAWILWGRHGETDRIVYRWPAAHHASLQHIDGADPAMLQKLWNWDWARKGGLDSSRNVTLPQRSIIAEPRVILRADPLAGFNDQHRSNFRFR